MINVSFKVPIKAKAQVAAYEDSDPDDILQAIKDEVLMWDIEDAEKYGRTYSQSYNYKSSPWQSNFDAMAKKSCLIQVLKYAPKAIESQKLVEATKTDNANIRSYKKEDDGNITLDVDYEVEVEEEQEEAPKNVDKETGEIKSEDIAQTGFFEDDFEPVKE